jgi:hypothetical protein
MEYINPFTGEGIRDATRPQSPPTPGASSVALPDHGVFVDNF